VRDPLVRTVGTDPDLADREALAERDQPAFADEIARLRPAEEIDADTFAVTASATGPICARIPM
jgi:hypothetical protein